MEIMVWVGRDPKNHLISTPLEQIPLKGETEAHRYPPTVTAENCAKGGTAKVCLTPCCVTELQLRNYKYPAHEKQQVNFSNFQMPVIQIPAPLSSPCSLHPSASLPEGALCLMPFVFFTAF